MAEQYVTESMGSSPSTDTRGTSPCSNASVDAFEYVDNTPSRHYSGRSLGGAPFQRYQPNISYRAYPYNYPYAMAMSYSGSPLPGSQAELTLHETLTKIMNGQVEMRSLIDRLSSRMNQIENSLLSRQSSSGSSSTENEAKRVCPQLSKLIRQIHDSLDDDDQFFPSIGSKDEHNLAVKQRITEEILLRKENCYTSTDVEKGIQRYFQSRRRIWRESNSEQHDRLQKQSKSRKLRSRKVRLYNRRKKAVHEGEEAQRFEGLSIEFMSDESSDSDSASDKMVVHRPAWRSRTLNLFLEELDKRVDAQQKDMKKHVPERKVRVLGTSANRHPPSDAPQWTIDTAWMEDHPDIEHSGEAN